MNYDDEKLTRMFDLQEAARRGSELHAFAHEAIRLGIKLPQNSKTLNLYVNDAVGYRMTPEMLLFYSPNCFGTPDAIGFSEKTKTLRISDLKTGMTEVSVKQLLIYAALFFLEYGRELDITPNTATTELRIYQNDECREYLADPIEVMWIMDRIITADAQINRLREEAL